MTVPPKIAIIYASQMGETKLMAEAIAEGATSIPGIKILIKEISYAVPEDVKDADAILIGGSPQNHAPQRSLSSFIEGLAKLDLKDKVGVAFGSCSSGEERGPLKKKMESFGLNLIEPGEDLGMASAGMASQEKAIKACFMLGRSVAQGVKGWS
jgi:NAD(P)H dehydrogenase (quinone)